MRTTIKDSNIPAPSLVPVTGKLDGGVAAPLQPGKPAVVGDVKSMENNAKKLTYVDVDGNKIIFSTFIDGKAADLKSENYEKLIKEMGGLLVREFIADEIFEVVLKQQREGKDNHWATLEVLNILSRLNNKKNKELELLSKLRKLCLTEDMVKQYLKYAFGSHNEWGYRCAFLLMCIKKENVCVFEIAEGGNLKLVEQIKFDNGGTHYILLEKSAYSYQRLRTHEYVPNQTIESKKDEKAVVKDAQEEKPPEQKHGSYFNEIQQNESLKTYYNSIKLGMNALATSVTVIKSERVLNSQKNSWDSVAQALQNMPILKDFSNVLAVIINTINEYKKAIEVSVLAQYFVHFEKVPDLNAQLATDLTLQQKELLEKSNIDEIKQLVAEHLKKLLVAILSQDLSPMYYPNDVKILVMFVVKQKPNLSLSRWLDRSVGKMRAFYIDKYKGAHHEHKVDIVEKEVSLNERLRLMFLHYKEIVQRHQNKDKITGADYFQFAQFLKTSRKYPFEKHHYAHMLAVILRRYALSKPIAFPKTMQDVELLAQSSEMEESLSETIGDRFRYEFDEHDADYFKPLDGEIHERLSAEDQRAYECCFTVRKILNDFLIAYEKVYPQGIVRDGSFFKRYHGRNIINLIKQVDHFLRQARQELIQEFYLLPQTELELMLCTQLRKFRQQQNKAIFTTCLNNFMKILKEETDKKINKDYGYVAPGNWQKFIEYINAKHPNERYYRSILWLQVKIVFWGEAFLRQEVKADYVMAIMENKEKYKYIMEGRIYLSLHLSSPSRSELKSPSNTSPSNQGSEGEIELAVMNEAVAVSAGMVLPPPESDSLQQPLTVVATPRTLQRLSVAFDNKESDDFAAVIGEISMLGAAVATPEILKGLSALLGDKQDYVRNEVAKAISNMGAAAATPEILQHLLVLMENKDTDIRDNAIYMLKQFSIFFPSLFRQRIQTAMDSQTTLTLLTHLIPGAYFSGKFSYEIIWNERQQKYFLCGFMGEIALTPLQAQACGRLIPEIIQQLITLRKLNIALLKAEIPKWPAIEKDPLLVDSQRSEFKQNLFTALQRWGGEESERLAVVLSLKEEVDHKALIDEAKAYGYECNNVPGDGNCFFHAVCHQLLQLNSKHYATQTYKTLREQVVEHVLQNFAAYKNFIDGSFEVFIEKLAMDRQWADGIVVIALSRLLKFTIVVIRNDKADPTIIRQNSNGVIYLGYEVGMHYQSLIRVQQHVPTKDLKALIDRTVLDDFHEQKPVAIPPAAGAGSAQNMYNLFAAEGVHAKGAKNAKDAKDAKDAAAAGSGISEKSLQNFNFD